jgi:hypothetical protein
MVDIGDMARKLSDLFPAETAAVLARLDDSVIYNRHNSDIDLMGLSVYYIYGGKEFGNKSLDIYSSMNMNQPHFIVGELVKILRPRRVFGCSYLNIDVNKYRGTSRETGNLHHCLSA